MAWWDSLIGAAASVGGALISSNANKEAAARASEGSREGAQIAADSYLKAAEISEQGNRQAQERLQPLATQSEPAIAYLRRVMAQDPSQLSPEQMRLVDDSMRGANATLAASGLRGSGRATVAALNDVNSRVRERAFTQNQQRSDQAGGKLAGINVEAVGGQADIDRRTAAARASAAEKGGEAFGKAAEREGNLEADAGTASGQTWGSALGYLGSLMADERKGRSGAYGTGQNIAWNTPRQEAEAV